MNLIYIPTKSHALVVILTPVDRKLQSQAGSCLWAKFSLLIEKCEWLRLCLAQLPKYVNSSLCKNWKRCVNNDTSYFKWKALGVRSHLGDTCPETGTGKCQRCFRFHYCIQIWSKWTSLSHSLGRKLCAECYKLLENKSKFIQGNIF